MVTLDFEKPIEALELKLDEIRALGSQNGVDVSTSVKDLEKKIKELKKSIYTNLTRWQRVQLARHPDRPYTLDYIAAVFDEFQELHGDRAFGDDKAMVGGLARLGEFDCVVVGQQKGRDTKSRQYRNFGMANPEGYRKALRLMRLAEKFHRPVITFIDTPGAFPGLEAEQRGQAEAIARNLLEMSVLKVPIICIIIGEGASGGALGIGIGDKVYMLENTWYSVISPESCSSILWRNWNHKEEAADALKLTAQDNLQLGLVDGIIPEPMGGAHRDPAATFATVRETLLKDLAKLAKAKPDTLVQKRIEKFAAMGAVEEVGAVAS
jgi:acetyl-CoA carboxylase carboxyl transferase subunit alpha